MNRPRIAFYAPLKSPNHANPSGDRSMARGLKSALSGMGEVTLVSELRTRDGTGDVDVQNSIIAQAKIEQKRLLKNGASWDVWVTYHNYYKAPDLLGPQIATALNIPYVLIEASRSSKRLTGKWAHFAALSERACDAADVIFYMTNRDRPALEQARPKGQRLAGLKPFLDQITVPEIQTRITGHNLLAVGMFRGGDKVASYANLAAALALVKTPGWRLDVVGDGPAKDDIHAMFAPFGPRMKFRGQLSSGILEQAYQGADLFVWPGVNEAFGMVYLEAQAHGLPVVAEDRVGVRDVVGPNSSLTKPNVPAQFAAAIDEQLSQIRARELVAQRSQAYVTENHLRPKACQQLAAEILPLLDRS